MVSRHCATRSLTTLVTNGSFITISGAMMSGPKLVRSPTRRSPNGLQLPTATVSFEAHRTSFLVRSGRFLLGRAVRVSHLAKPVLHVHAQALEWNLLRMVGKELRDRTIGDAATFGKQKLFGDPVLNPGRWDARTCQRHP